jgi:drug/metabolite transporter (DMT)-like permease
MRRLLSGAASGALFTILSALGFGLLPILSLYVYRSGVNVVTMLFIRFAIAAVLLLLYARLRRGGGKAGRMPLAAVAALGLFYTLQSAFYLSAVRFVPVSLATLILYFYPALVCLLSFLFEGTRLQWKTLASLAVSSAGLLLVLGTTFGRLDGRGVLLAAGAALVYSFYITLSNRVLKRVAPLDLMGAISLSCALLFLLAGGLFRSLDFRFDPAALAPLAAIVLFCTLASILFFFRGIELLGPSRTAILSMAEPLFSILLAALLFRDRLSLQQAIGGACLLGGIFLVTLTRQKPQRPVPLDGAERTT